MSAKKSPALRPLSCSAFDSLAVKCVNVFALLHNGEFAGRIVVAHPTDGAGVMYATVVVWGGPLSYLPSSSGRAGGYGYHKGSAAVGDAFARAISAHDSSDGCSTVEASTAAHALSSVHGEGWSAIREPLESVGYTVLDVL